MKKKEKYCLIFSFDWGLRHGHISLLPANPRNTHILTFSLYIAFNIGIKEICWCITIRTPFGTTRWTVVVNSCQEGGTWKLDSTEFKFTAQLYHNQVTRFAVWLVHPFHATLSAGLTLGIRRQLQGPRGREHATCSCPDRNGPTCHVMRGPSRSEIRGGQEGVVRVWSELLCCILAISNALP